MKVNIKLILGAIGILLLIALIVSGGVITKLIKENKRISTNQELLLNDKTTLQEEVKKFKFRDSLNAISIQTLTLSVSELKENFPKLAKEMKDLKIPLGRVETVTNSLLTHASNITTPVKDTVVLIDSVRIPAITFDYRSKFQTISGIILKRPNVRDSIQIKSHTQIPLEQVLYRIPKFKIWFIRFGTKAVEQVAWSENKDITIEYSRVLQIKKKP